MKSHALMFSFLVLQFLFPAICSAESAYVIDGRKIRITSTISFYHDCLSSASRNTEARGDFESFDEYQKRIAHERAGIASEIEVLCRKRLGRKITYTRTNEFAFGYDLMAEQVTLEKILQDSEYLETLSKPGHCGPKARELSFYDKKLFVNSPKAICFLKKSDIICDYVDRKDAKRIKEISKLLENVFIATMHDVGRDKITTFNSGYSRCVDPGYDHKVVNKLTGEKLFSVKYKISRY